MSVANILGVLGFGFAAGLSSGMLGIGGGGLFVPGLVICLGLSQLHAEATSLLAIIPVAGLGAWRQRGYGNVHLRDALAIGALSPVGVAAGTLLANALPQRLLAFLFTAAMLYFGVSLVRRAVAP